jgi:Flp pilus assembly protein TadB
VTVWPAAVLAASAVVLVVPSPAQGLGRASPSPPAVRDDVGWMHRWRWGWTVLAALAGATFVSGRAAVPGALVAGWFTWRLIGRAEPVAVRRRREAASRDLPGLVHLLATALESGCDVGTAVRVVCDALPGPAADGLATVPLRLALGLDLTEAWRPVRSDPALAPLARAMVRAHRSGASVTAEVSRLAAELGARTRQRVEERARTVGVRAALPLGLCLLPAFILVGVVPLVVGLMRSLQL